MAVLNLIINNEWAIIVIAGLSMGENELIQELIDRLYSLGERITSEPSKKNVFFMEHGA